MDISSPSVDVTTARAGDDNRFATDDQDMTSGPITRRHALLLAMASPIAWTTRGLQASPSCAPSTHPGRMVREAVRRGGVIVLMRHGLTEPGLGDPPGFQLNDCTTQRNLSEAGRHQSRRMGQWLRQEGLIPARVRSSQWCRCLESANEAFRLSPVGSALPIEPWPALNSFFQGHGHRDHQLRDAMAAARDLAVRARPGEFEVWVTHQVTISALTGHALGMGEIVVATYDMPDRPLKVLASGLCF